MLKNALILIYILVVLGFSAVASMNDISDLGSGFVRKSDADSYPSATPSLSDKFGSPDEHRSYPR